MAGNVRNKNNKDTDDDNITHDDKLRLSLVYSPVKFETPLNEDLEEYFDIRHDMKETLIRCKTSNQKMGSLDVLKRRLHESLQQYPDSNSCYEMAVRQQRSTNAFLSVDPRQICIGKSMMIFLIVLSSLVLTVCLITVTKKLFRKRGYKRLNTKDEKINIEL